MLKSMTFNGIRKPWIHLLEGRQKSPFAPTKSNLIKVAGMPGAHVGSKEIDVLYITQPIGFIVKDDEHALQLKDELAEWLLTDEAVPLEFDDELGRTYYAEIEGTIEEFSKFVDQRKGVITFLCADPFSYSPERSEEFQSDTAIIENKGTAEAKPIFELEVNEPTTYIMVANDDDEYMMIGEPVDVLERPFTRYERIFYTDATSTDGWANANSGEIDGIVAGTMESNGTRFQATDFGTGVGWHGPAKKQSLSENLKNFRLEAFISLYNKNAPRYVGRVELYLLDASGNQIAKVTMKDTQSAQALAWGEARAGGTTDNHFLINEYGDRPGNWNDFYGIVRIERENNKWNAYFAMVDPVTKRHFARRFAPEWADTQGLYGADVAQVVVHFGQYTSHPAPSHGMYSASVYKINQQVDAIPFIAQPGDIVTFDNTGMGELLINGESFKKRKDVGATYFGLKPGENRLALMPDGTTGTVKWRDPFR